MAKQFCCCKLNLNAAKILAIVFIFQHGIQLAIEAYGMANPNLDKAIGIADDDIDNVKLLRAISIGFFGVYLVVDFCLLVGAYKRITCLLWFWLVVNGLSVVFTLTSAILTFSAMSIIVAACTILLTVWAMLAVYGSIQEIKEQKREADVESF